MEVIQESDFNTKVIKQSGIILIDFYADWCSPCRMVMPILEEAASELNVTAYKVNIDNSGDLATEYGIMSIPTILLFKDGELKDSIVGAASKIKITDWIKSFI